MLENGKLKHLKEISNKLKQDFCGLDEVIDKIISAITAWYIMPSLQTRPLIINLWGLTGTGKTALIRKLVEYLDFQDRFAEVNIPQQILSERERLIRYLLNESDLVEHQPGIILLDEFQALRSKSDNPHQDESKKSYQDIWQLLSDGKINNKFDFMTRLISYMSDLKEANQTFVDSFTKDNIKRLLGLQLTPKELFNTSSEELMEIVNDAFINPKKYIKETDYTKTLIFICGNLDSAYTMANAITDIDINPDVFYEMTKNINVLDIKEALQDYFSPEQISRLGNIHVIYPSFNKKTYEEIINKRLKEIKDHVKEKINFNINFNSSVTDFIFQNGIYPAQGTRPVYSTIAYCIESNIPKIIIDSPENSNIDINITSKDGKYYLNNIEVFSDIQNIRNKLNIEDIKIIAVHEAGHILANVYLRNSIPRFASAKAISNNQRGFVIDNDLEINRKVQTKQDLLKDIMVSLAGYCAEEVIFGFENISTGSRDDLGKATSIALDMYRVYSMVDKNSIGWFNHPNIMASNSNDKNNFQLTDRQFATDKILLECKDKVKQLLTDFNRNGELIKLSDMLIENDILTEKDILEVVKKGK